MTEWSFDETGFGTRSRRIRWEDLVAVGIRTTEDGPFAEDVFWTFLHRGGVDEIPASRLPSFDALVSHLPGFDAFKVVIAMGSCKERVFRIWHEDESAGRPDRAALGERFGRLLARLGAREDATSLLARTAFERLYAAWSSGARRYHDVEHLTDGLRELDGAFLPGRDVVEFAYFYHDAVYEAGQAGCEAKSAAWLLRDATELGVPAEIAARAEALVLATSHAGALPTENDAALLCDVDLSILGRDPLRFMEYEYGVEEEFARVPRVAFLRGRGRFLDRLLEKPIYRTVRFRERYEAKARANVTALLESDRYRTYRWLRWLSR